MAKKRNLRQRGARGGASGGARELSPEALAQLVERDLRGAANHVRRQLERNAPADAILETAAEVASRCRRAGFHAETRALALAGAPRSRRLRLEGVLSAFASGDDDAARQLAAPDPDVLAAVEPLLVVARGVKDAEVKEHSAMALPRRAPARRALALAAEAVACAQRGDAPGAQASVTKIPTRFKDALGASALRAAARVAAPKDAATATRAMGVLRADAKARSSVWNAAVVEIAQRLPKLAEAMSQDPATSESARIAALARSAQGDHGSGGSEAVAAAFGERAFDDKERAAACLYEGFAWLHRDSGRALDAFDRAVRAGADLEEVYRGKLLVAMRGKTEYCEGCGHAHPAEPDDIEVARNGDRLARLASKREPLLLPVLGQIAGAAWMRAGDERGARASVQMVGSHASGAERDDLDVLLAHTYMPDQPKRAIEVLEAVLARSPEHASARRLRISIASYEGDAESPLQLAPAREEQPIRADAIAMAMLREADCTPDPSEAVEKLLRRMRDAAEALALPAEDCVAIDVAALAIADELALPTKKLAEAAVARAASSPILLEQLAAATAVWSDSEPLAAACHLLAETAGNEACEAVVRGLVAGGAAVPAHRVLIKNAAQLERARLSRLERLVLLAPPYLDEPPPAARVIERRLQPGFELDEISFELQSLHQGSSPSGPDDDGSLLEEVFTELGFDLRHLAKLDAATRAELEVAAEEVFFSGRSTDADIGKLMSKLSRAMGVSIPTLISEASRGPKGFPWPGSARPPGPTPQSKRRKKRPKKSGPKKRRGKR